MKRCRKCGIEQSLEDFYRQATAKDGRRPRCKACTKIDQHALSLSRSKDPVKKARIAAQCKARWDSGQTYYYVVKRQYNFSQEQYEQMLDDQCGVCAICGGACYKQRLSVDHDHRCCPRKTSCGNCIRGLLCSRCNHGIGLLGDSPERLLIAAQYIEERSHNGGRT